MKFYIVDDVRGIVKVLDRIIEEKKLGEVIGFSTDAMSAEAEIIAKEPDIVLVDLLMPIKDGIKIVSDVKVARPNIRFVMISQVSNKEMVSEAYNAGIEFFISKPINIIEVENVLHRVATKIKMEKALFGIRDMLQATGHSQLLDKTPVKKDPLKEIKYLLGVLGMLGERGTKDILGVCQISIDKREVLDSDRDIKTYCKAIREDEKMVKQRIRRAVKKGLTNTAHMGIEEFYNEVYQEYGQLVFDFESLKSEMDYLRGAKDAGGKANIAKFIEGLLTYQELR